MEEDDSFGSSSKEMVNEDGCLQCTEYGVSEEAAEEVLASKSFRSLPGKYGVENGMARDLTNRRDDDMLAKRDIE